MFGHSGTVDYFESHRHDYSPRRLRFATAMIKERRSGADSLIDVGCGTGNVLSTLVDATDLTDVLAMDVSAACLDVARERVGCPTVLASILEVDDLAPLRDRYDFVVVAAVLHHLVAGTRRGSRRAARRGLSNALSLAKPGGHLVLLEPVFAPRAAMMGVFWVKRLTTAVTTGRVPVFGYWNNIGAPLVSFYSHEEVVRMAQNLDDADVVAVERQSWSLGWLDAVLTRADTTVLVRRNR
jgi:2-polyprenyl-3-methyl-5-hydroxy-6-metoxy-1,4-benzoquinol methylase